MAAPAALRVSATEQYFSMERSTALKAFAGSTSPVMLKTNWMFFQSEGSFPSSL